MARQRTVLIGGGTARTAPAVIGAFLAAGYGVTVTGRDPDRLHAALAAIPGGEAAHAVTADLADPAAAERAVAATLERWGRVDAMTTLVQAAFLQRPFAETSLADFEALVIGGLYTTYNLARAVLPAMLAAGGGHIVTIAGGSAVDPAPGRARCALDESGRRDADQGDCPRLQAPGHCGELPGGRGDRYGGSAAVSQCSRLCCGCHAAGVRQRAGLPGLGGGIGHQRRRGRAECAGGGLGPAVRQPI